MLELLAPACSQEGVIAAVQSGADSVYIDFRDIEPESITEGFTDEGLALAVRYCRIRNCRVYAWLDVAAGDAGLTPLTRRAKLAADLGADAVILSDLGFARALRSLLPDMKLHAGPRMDLHSLGGVEAAAELGFSRAALSPELNLAALTHIASRSPIQTEIAAHGPLCVAHGGSCRFASFLTHCADSRGFCDAPCRRSFSMGGRMDEFPLSLRDVSLLEHLDELGRSGAACLRIGGLKDPAEYIAIVTESYRKAMDSQKPLTPQETAELLAVSPTSGWTDGYFTGDRGPAMFGRREPHDRDAQKLLSAARRRYAGSERRRVPVEFFAVIKKDKPSQFAALDMDGCRAAVTAPPPGPPVVRKLTVAGVEEELYKTGGTPYSCTKINAIVDDGLDMPPDVIAEARQKLLTELTRQRRRAPVYVTGQSPQIPQDMPLTDAPRLIVQVRGESQLTEELAALKPDYIYVPLELLVESYEKVRPFVLAGVSPVAVMPPVVTDAESGQVTALLRRAVKLGVGEALTENFGHILMARRCGMSVRGGLGLEASNSQSLALLADAGLLSATLSCELKLADVKELKKPLDTELIVYGRMPVMITDHCIIKNSSGRCTCQNVNSLSDQLGSVFPVVKEFGCRNVIYGARKVFLADKRADYSVSGLWGARLHFTTESPRECVQVVKSYMGLLGYRPNNLTRGLYYRGVD